VDRPDTIPRDGAMGSERDPLRLARQRRPETQRQVVHVTFGDPLRLGTTEEREDSRAKLVLCEPLHPRNDMDMEVCEAIGLGEEGSVAKAQVVGLRSLAVGCPGGRPDGRCGFRLSLAVVSPLDQGRRGNRQQD